MSSTSLTFRRFATLATASLAIVGASTNAQGWPQAPIRLIVPWAAGGTTDMIARVLSEPLARALGQPVIVDNKPGAGGNIGTAQAVKEKPDGYTLILATSTTQAINPHLYQKTGFDPKKDFTSIIYLGSVPNVLVVSAKSPFKSVQDVLNQARKDPGKLSYGSGGNGSSQHIAGSMFKQAANVEILHVPYKGGAPAVSDLMAGQIDIMLDTGSMGHIQGGSLRALAVASAKRVPALPQVPTFAEAGLPGLQAAAWYGVTGPAGIPKEIVGRLNGEFNKLLKDPVVAKRLQDIGAEIGGGTSQDLERLAESELRRYGAVLKDGNIKVD